MPCKAPLTAYRPTLGGPVTFTRPQQRTYEQLSLPCGQCILCRQEHTRQWAVRIVHEEQRHSESSFITLTLRDEFINELGSLNYEEHMQPFIKRLRKRLWTKYKKRISHYSVGEYGEATMRPHYHMCLFGHAFNEDRRFIRRGQKPLWTNPLLEETWGMGNCSVGILNFETAAYTAGYVMKKLKGAEGYHSLDPETGELVEIEAPAARMSVRPAIGLKWIEKYGKATFGHDHVIVNGRPQKPPKFYDGWLKKRSEIASQMLKATRKKRAVTTKPENLDARARVAHARAERRGKKV